MLTSAGGSKGVFKEASRRVSKRTGERWGDSLLRGLRDGQ